MGDAIYPHVRFTDPKTGAVNGVLQPSGQLALMDDAGKVTYYDSWQDFAQDILGEIPEPATWLKVLSSLLGDAAYVESGQAVIAPESGYWLLRSESQTVSESKPEPAPVPVSPGPSSALPVPSPVVPPSPSPQRRPRGPNKPKEPVPAQSQVSAALPPTPPSSPEVLAPMATDQPEPQFPLLDESAALYHLELWVRRNGLALTLKILTEIAGATVAPLETVGLRASAAAINECAGLLHDAHTACVRATEPK